MSNLGEELSKRRRALCAEERTQLVDDLRASFEEPADTCAEAALENEIGRRVEETKSAKARLFPADEDSAETARIYK